MEAIDKSETSIKKGTWLSTGTQLVTMTKRGSSENKGSPCASISAKWEGQDPGATS